MLETLKNLITDQLALCTDADTLDLVLKLLLTAQGGD